MEDPGYLRALLGYQKQDLIGRSIAMSFVFNGMQYHALSWRILTFILPIFFSKLRLVHHVVLCHSGEMNSNLVVSNVVQLSVMCKVPTSILSLDHKKNECLEKYMIRLFL